jgi:hypothetical protein
MLVAARLRHVAGTRWGMRKYFDMQRSEINSARRPLRRSPGPRPAVTSPLLRGSGVTANLPSRDPTQCAHLDGRYLPLPKLAWRNTVQPPHCRDSEIGAKTTKNPGNSRGLICVKKASASCTYRRRLPAKQNPKKARAKVAGSGTAFRFLSLLI